MTPGRPRAARSRKPTRQLLTIDVQHFPEIRGIVAEQAIKRQFGASEPFLRRILYLLFIDGHISKLPI